MKYLCLLFVLSSLSANEIRANQSICTKESWDKLQEWILISSEKDSSEVIDDMIFHEARILLRVNSSLKRRNKGVCFLNYLIQKNNSAARAELIWFYIKSNETMGKAKNLAIEGSRNHEARSQYYLSILMDDDERILEKHNDEWLEISSKKNYMPAVCLLGYKYNMGSKKQVGFKLMLKAAKQNIVRCQYRVAVAYLKGAGIEKSDCLSKKWADLASGQYFQKATYLLEKNKSKYSKCK